jgi:hypothetical protein
LAHAKTGIRWNYQRVLFVLLFTCLILFAARFYVGSFLVFNDFRRPLNQPVVPFPTIDSTPWHLSQGSAKSGSAITRNSERASRRRHVDLVGGLRPAGRTRRPPTSRRLPPLPAAAGPP